uniref:Carbonic anhydrase n=1 Tax=Opuntia streptacantha TaxID=393608 RepID=A0A7C9DTV8_OPUST
MNMASSSSVLFFLLLVPSLASEKRKVAEESNLGVENASLCSSGKSQSPIDIITSETFINKSLEPLTRNYHVFNASLLTDGKHLQVPFSVRGGLIIDGKTYNLKQMHWHTPSEHRINGIQYAAELHEVHIAADGSATVVGILFEEGPPSPLLTMLKPQLDELAKKPCEGPQEEVAVPTFASSFLRRRPRRYYRYMGSLTTPPCTEKVLWNVLAKVKTISKDQVALLKATVCGANKENARPTQPLNGRIVQKYDGN